MKTNIHFFILSCSVLLRMRNVSDKSCRENQKRHFMFNNLFYRESCHLWGNLEKHCGAEQAPYDNRVHDHCMLDI